MYVCSLENLEEVRKKLQERITWYKETVAMIDNSRTFLRVSLEINIFRSYIVNVWGHLFVYVRTFEYACIHMYVQ